MLSVAHRIKTVQQPLKGYVPVALFMEYHYVDEYSPAIIEPAFAPIQGMAVDYMTRFLLTNDKEAAFNISIMGAKLVDEAMETNKELINIKKLLNGVTGLDDLSIKNACQIVGYDTAYRAGVKAFQDVNTIIPNEKLIENVRIMVIRGLTFLKSVQPIIKTEVTFEGGYTTLVSSGDGDYLTKDTIIDFKVSTAKLSSKWTLQLLMYYLLGIHSKHSEFKQIKYLCIFNPYENKSYVADLKDISDESKYKVSNLVLGYKMTYSRLSYNKEKDDYTPDYSKWEYVEGSDINVTYAFLRENFSETDFDINDYVDGIHNITTDDYWTFLRRHIPEYETSTKPIFRYTDHIVMIKHNGYYMFLSVSPKGKLSVLHGASLKRAEYSPEYYFDNIERYSLAVVNRFSKYWDALYKISDTLQSLEPDQKSVKKTAYVDYLNRCKVLNIPHTSFQEWYKENKGRIKLSGRVHGCIVDIDYLNHIYLNPYDGTVAPYSAISMYDKNVYKNTMSLISAKRPEMLPAFKELSKKEPTALVLAGTSERHDLVTVDDTIDTDFVKEYSYDMYAISNRLKGLQAIYDYKLVIDWYDNILNDNKALLEDKYLIKKPSAAPKTKYVGNCIEQYGGRRATLIAYRNSNDVDIAFEDRVTLYRVTVDKWKNGKLVHPDMQEEYDKQERQKKQNRAKTQNTISSEPKKSTNQKLKYLGMTRMMNCGMKATIIEYINCNNITVQFEDGVIRSNIRSDHFMDGKVRHTQ